MKLGKVISICTIIIYISACNTDLSESSEEGFEHGATVIQSSTENLTETNVAIDTNRTILMDLVFSDRDCTAGCWQGLEIDEATISQAEQRIVDITSNRSLFSNPIVEQNPNVNSKRFVFNTTDPTLFLSIILGYSESSEALNGINLVWGRVDQASFDTPTLIQFFNHFGNPQEIYVSSLDIVLLTIHLYYHEGIYITARMATEESTVCFDTPLANSASVEFAQPFTSLEAKFNTFELGQQGTIDLDAFAPSMQVFGLSEQALVDTVVSQEPCLEFQFNE